MKQNPVAWEYDWDGAYVPGSEFMASCRTFSVGIFQWVPKVGGKGLKRSAVKTRIRGLVANPQEVYQKAREMCDKLNNVKGVA